MVLFPESNAVLLGTFKYFVHTEKMNTIKSELTLLCLMGELGSGTTFFGCVSYLLTVSMKATLKSSNKDFVDRVGLAETQFLSVFSFYYNITT